MIDPDKIHAYFSDNHGPIQRSTNGWWDAKCPFCGNWKLAFNPEYSSVKCWKGCFKGSAVNFVKEYYAVSTFEAYSILDDLTPKLQLEKHLINQHPIRKDITLPDSYTPILDGTTPMARRARKYLERRGFDLNYLDMLGVGYCTKGKYMGYIIIPFKKDGNIVYFIGRDYLNRGDARKYKNPPREEFGIGKSEVLFNEEALHLFKKVYLLEGWADAATLGNNAISIQGKDLSLWQADSIINSPVEEIVVVPDVGAMKEGYNMVQQLYTRKLVRFLEMEKLAIWGCDVNEIGADKVIQLEQDSGYIRTKLDFIHHARSINTRKEKLIS